MKIDFKKAQHLSPTEAATIIQSHYRGYITRAHLYVEHEAATIIQAHYRGYRARQKLLEEYETTSMLQSSYGGYNERTEMLIPYYCNDVFQACQRGYRTGSPVRQDHTNFTAPKRGYKPKGQCSSKTRISNTQSGVGMNSPEAIIKNNQFSYSPKIGEEYNEASLFKERSTVTNHRNTASFCSFSYDDIRTKSKDEMRSKIPRFIKYKCDEEQELYQQASQNDDTGLETVSPVIPTQQDPEYQPHRQKTRKLLKEEHKAASVIQALWKGYLARKEIKKMKEAVAKIQAAFRGFQLRKRLFDDDFIGFQGDYVLHCKGTSTTGLDSTLPSKASKAYQHSSGEPQRGFIKVQPEKHNLPSKTKPQIQPAVLTESKTINAVSNYTAPTTISTYCAWLSSGERRPRKFRTRKQHQQNNNAATVIQAHWKGYQVRKQLKKQDLAASKIQTMYHRYRIRRLLQDDTEFDNYGKSTNSKYASYYMTDLNQQHHQESTEDNFAQKPGDEALPVMNCVETMPAVKDDSTPKDHPVHITVTRSNARIENHRKGSYRGLEAHCTASSNPAKVLIKINMQNR
ncbi:mitochondrial import receptor subunit TOM5 homolog isoform X1 [Latimeria chalumnae]|uniref:mitochondrial import receptor subunit TOM5 homolog isoform X1 n=1 Tax=Latimeria chalumnae TaxID=7897 RepID=UPI0003C13764